MNITVILCTFNRAGCLGEALQSLALSRVPSSVEWEVLVVDNNSNDRTYDVVEEFCQRYKGRFRYLFEPKPGKSNALNAGILEALGDVVAFVDDDATVEPDWLHNLTSCFENSKWSGVGGRILPAKSVPLPPWLSLTGPYGMGGVVAALFNLGDKPCELCEPPYGTNMAFRKAVFEKYGGFRTDLGPVPGSQIRNEDTEFGRRLLSRGERFFYEPSAVVYHPILESRVNKEFLLSWYYDFGRAGVREIGHRPDVWGIPRPYLTMLKAAAIRTPLSVASWMVAWEPKQRFYRKTKVWEAMGEMAEIHNRWFAKKESAAVDVARSIDSPEA